MSTVTVVVPTFRREQPLIDTINDLLVQDYPVTKICVVDQTLEHTPEVLKALESLAASGKIIWHKPPQIDFASLTKARNVGLREADTDLILFVDDDVRVAPNFIAEHAACFIDPAVGATAGRVIVPHHTYPTAEPTVIAGVTWWGSFVNNFYGNIEKDCDGFVGCNFCLRASLIPQVGIFDERFTGNAMREETDMAIRIRRAGFRIRFTPSAHVDHLMDPSGGTRADAKIAWYKAFFHNHFLFYGKHFGAWRQPFFLLHLTRPILGCSIVHGHLRPMAIVTPWQGIVSGLRAASKSKQNGEAMLKKIP